MRIIRPKKQIRIEDLTSTGWPDYELLDSGNQQKLERFGHYRLVRFEPEAVWKPALEPNEWSLAQARFNLEKGNSQGSWIRQSQMPDEWTIKLAPLKFNLYIKRSRHVGIFPEQLPNWQWIKQKVSDSGREINVLNLFAYTGVSTAFAALAGAQVTHVEAAKSAITIARKNLQDSCLSEQPVRWIVDDAFKFVEREMRRGNRYDGIIMDPPKFGRGPGGEVWKFENGINELVQQCAALLSKEPKFFILTAYNVGTHPRDLGTELDYHLSKFGGEVICGSLIQQERSAGRKISQAIYARWEKT